MIRFRFGVTDASRDQWPSEEPDRDKNTKFTRNVVDSTDPRRSRYWADWLSKLGFALAKQLKLSNWDSDYYVLEDFPDGYGLFDYLQVGKAKDGEDRHDAHLKGSTTATKAFLSPNEFVMHAVWLLTNGPGKPYRACACQSCTGRKQTEINAEFNIDSTYAGRDFSNVRRPLVRRRPRKKTKKSKAERRTSSEFVAQTFLGPLTEKQRVLDLVYLPHHRIGELVWAELDHALEHAEGKYTLTHWPAIITARHVQVNPNANRRDLRAKDARRHVYSAQLLALETRLAELEEWEIRPWLGIHPPTYNKEDMMRPETIKHVFDGKHVVMPTLPSFHSKSANAMAAYLLALETWIRIEGVFSMVDAHVPKQNSTDTASATMLCSSVWWGPELLHMGDLVRVLDHPDLFSDIRINRPRQPASPPAWPTRSCSASSPSTPSHPTTRSRSPSQG